MPSPGPNQLCVRVSKSLISAGTELAKVRGLTRRQNGSEERDPLPLGYSAAGVVVSTGSRVSEFVPGDRVSAHAAHATYAIVDADRAAHLPSNVTFEQGTFGTLGAVALHAVRLSGLRVGETCAVVGFGTIGQLIALCARIAGARRVFVAEHRALRRELALQLGFEAPPRHSSFDIVFEAAGTQSALVDAFALTKPCGRTINAGSLREPIEVDVYRDVHRKGITLVGVHGSTQHRGEWRERDNRAAILDFIADNRLPVGALISHRFAAADAIEAFEVTEHGDACGVILNWE